MTTDDDVKGGEANIWSMMAMEEEENVWPLMLFNDPPLTAEILCCCRVGMS
jgi:hypothetical protein